MKFHCPDAQKPRWEHAAPTGAAGVSVVDVNEVCGRGWLAVGDPGVVLVAPVPALEMRVAFVLVDFRLAAVIADDHGQVVDWWELVSNASTVPAVGDDVAGFSPWNQVLTEIDRSDRRLALVQQVVRSPRSGRGSTRPGSAPCPPRGSRRWTCRSTQLFSVDPRRRGHRSCRPCNLARTGSGARRPSAHPRRRRRPPGRTAPAHRPQG